MGIESRIRKIRRPGVPWPIWVAVAMLGLEGLGNLLNALDAPINLYWLAMKCLLIVGLIRGWVLVFVLSLVLSGLHVLGFAAQAPVVAMLNLVLFLLVASAWRYYLPRRAGARFVPGDPMDREFLA